VGEKKAYHFRKTGEVFNNVIKELEDPDPTIKFPTYITELDNMIHGLRKGRLTVVSARPGGGKSSLAAQIGWENAKHGANVFLFALEMSSEEVLMRIVANELEIDHDLFYQDQGLSEETLTKIHECKEKFYKTPFGMFDDIGYRFNDVEQVLKEFEVKPDIVIVDHVQLISKPKYSNTNEALEEYARNCKRIARTENIAFVLLSQINRSAEGRNRSPKLEHLKGSGALEEIADTVIIGS
jgi:replicative DNA helicase